MLNNVGVEECFPSSIDRGITKRWCLGWGILLGSVVRIGVEIKPTLLDASKHRHPGGACINDLVGIA